MALLREENKVEEVKLLLEVAVGNNSALPEDSAVRQEFALLKPLMTPLSKDVTLDELEKNSTRFTDDKQLKLHKVMCNFPTGLQILEGVTSAVSARKRDVELVVKLNTAADLLKAAPTLKEDAMLGDVTAAADHFGKIFAICVEAWC